MHVLVQVVPSAVPFGEQLSVQSQKQPSIIINREHWSTQTAIYFYKSTWEIMRHSRWDNLVSSWRGLFCDDRLTVHSCALHAYLPNKNIPIQTYKIIKSLLLLINFMHICWIKVLTSLKKVYWLKHWIVLKLFYNLKNSAYCIQPLV